MTLWHLLRKHMLRHPFQLIKTEKDEFTCEDIVKIAESYAERLKNQECCAIYCASELITAIMLLACFAAGVTAVPLSIKYGRKHCEKIIKKISPSCIITDLNGQLNIYNIRNYDYHCNTPQKPALIMHTSGTTGMPKSIMLSEKNILCNLDDISEYFQLDINDKILISRPLYHIAVLNGEFLLALLKGAQIIFYDKPFNAIEILNLIEKEKITTYCNTPTVLSLLARYKTRYTSELKLENIVISGECMGKATGMSIRAAFPNTKIYHVYGLTEASPRVCYLPPRYFDIEPDCVGIPLKSNRIEIRDSNDNVVPDGELGTLWIYGPNIMIGYYKDAELTRRTFKNGWFCTGDIAKIKNNGLLKIYGRSDDMIIRSGMNIYPAEIETIIKEDSRVQDVFVYGIQDAIVGTKIGMKLTGNFSSIEEIKKLCIEKLPNYQVPSKIDLVAEMPKNEFGKIMRSECKNA